MNKYLLILLTFITCLFGANCFAQTPNISYTSPQTYYSTIAITSLSPLNSGGAVPATVYGQVSTFAGSGAYGFANGIGTAATFTYPIPVATDALGNVYVGDGANFAIRKITPSGSVSLLAGTGAVGSADGQGAAASFWEISGIVIDANGNLFVTDGGNNLIRKVTPSGLVSTFLANGTASPYLSRLGGITLDATGIFILPTIT